MILNGDEILEYHANGKIAITPWDEKRVGTNSYDVVLSPKLKRYTHYGHGVALDPRQSNPVEEFDIPSNGFLLRASQFVLGATNEYCENLTNDLVPMIEGRSSIARLGLTIHSSAGYGDVGFCGNWTLEITAAEDIIIYQYMPIGQLYWVRTTPTERKYKGKYQGQMQVTESRLNQEKF